MKNPSGSLGQLKRALASPDFPDYQRNFTAQVEFYKKLARAAWTKSLPEEKKKQAQNIARFRELEKLLNAELRDFTKENFKNPGPAFYDRANALILFMYLFDKTLELHEAVLKKNRMGLYALYDAVNNSMYRLLSVGYFRRPLMDVMKDYLATEPQLVACAELAETELVPMQSAVALYQPKLKDRVVALIKREEDAEKKKKSIPSKGKKAKTRKKGPCG